MWEQTKPYRMIHSMLKGMKDKQGGAMMKMMKKMMSHHGGDHDDDEDDEGMSSMYKMDDDDDMTGFQKFCWIDEDMNLDLQGMLKEWDSYDWNGNPWLQEKSKQGVQDCYDMVMAMPTNI